MYNAIAKQLFMFVCHIILVAALTGLTSCKKEKTTDPPVDSKATLTKIVNGEDFIQLGYNPGGTVSSITTTLLSDDEEAVTYSVQYSEDKKIKELNGEDGMRITPVYDEGVLIRTHFHKNGVHIAYAAYQVNGGIAKEVTLYGRDENDFSPALSYRLEYNAKGNVRESVLMIPGEIPGQLVREGHIAYEFDEKENPLYQHKELMLLFMQAVSRNNVLKEEYFDKNFTVEDRYRYAYTYKTNGLPEKAVIKVGLNDTNATEKEVLYSYQ